MNRLFSIIVGCAFALSFSVQAETKVGGFVDAQYQWADKPENTSGFVLNDAAVYLSAEVAGSKAMLDIPISGNFTGSTPNLQIGQAKAQAYLTHRYDMGLEWTLGQFDKIMGMEANDTVDVVFSSQGLLHANLSAVHLGLLTGYSNEQFGIHLLVADRRGHGSKRSVSTVTPPVTTTRNMEIGAKLSFDGGQFHAQGVFIGWKDKTTDQMETTLDFVFGGEFGQFTADAELLMYKTAVLNADSQLGIAGQGVYAVDDMLSLGMRVEYLSKLANRAGVAQYTQLALTPGLQYKLTEALTGKVDYTLTSSKTLEADTSSTTAHGINIAGVFSL